MEEDDFSSGSMDNSDKVSDEELQSSESFHCTSAARVVFTTKATYESFTWAGR
jgi:hypothetical protein